MKNRIDSGIFKKKDYLVNGERMCYSIRTAY